MLNNLFLADEVRSERVSEHIELDEENKQFTGGYGNEKK